MSTRLSYIQQKIVSAEEAVKLVNLWKVKDEGVVFTNGCFDILHQGHVTYLAEAASHGHRLIIGLNTNASVKRLGKGDDRPVNDEAARAMVIAALGVVDLVVFFDEDTPLELIRALNPDVLAKGADYDPSEINPESKKYIVGSDLIHQNGGEVVAVPLVEGFSTTAILAKLRS
ncbi:MAG: rfaE bifunctional protein nucleotidyltransferase chain/domain [Crocinitomicaceae bacterium]|jgi:rfaE bifunctional protein nucleotidyltransferase chain/domain